MSGISRRVVDDVLAMLNARIEGEERPRRRRRRTSPRRRRRAAAPAPSSSRAGAVEQPRQTEYDVVWNGGGGLSSYQQRESS